MIDSNTFIFLFIIWMIVIAVSHILLGLLEAKKSTHYDVGDTLMGIITLVFAMYLLWGI
jgi:hypothetical protein